MFWNSRTPLSFASILPKMRSTLKWNQILVMNHWYGIYAPDGTLIYGFSSGGRSLPYLLEIDLGVLVKT